MGLNKVVVIGGGIAGASISRYLARHGVQVQLLEKSGMLCSGATWHAAGLVTRFAGSAKLKKLHVRSMELLREVHDEFGIGLHLPGSIRIIEKGNEDRMREAEYHVAMASLFDSKDYPTTIISAEEVKRLHPLVDISTVDGGVYTGTDGDVDPSQLTNAVARQARAAGALIRLNARVIGVDAKPNGGFVVKLDEASDNELLECDAVVNAAGLWSRDVASMAPLANGKRGLHHPAFVIEHQYVVTETLPQVKKLAEDGHNGGRLPVLRDLRGSSYIRQEGNGFLIGPYEEECFVRRDMPSGPPASFSMELFEDKLDRIEDNIVMGTELIPCLGEAGIKTVVNGPTIWTGDSLPRCGRSSLPGWYDFNCLSYGIAQGLPLSEYLGHIMLEGEQPAGFDCSDYFDPLRYGSWATDEFVSRKIQETYVHNNRIAFPFENRSAGRDIVVSKEGSDAQYPLHSVLEDHGARFAAFGGSGCEAPLVYVPKTEKVDFHDAKRYSHFEWASLAKAEADHALEHVALSYSSFSKLLISGNDSKEFLGEVTTAVLPKRKAKDRATDFPCGLTYCTTPKGQVCTEFTMCSLDDEGKDWYLVGSRDHVRQDMAWLNEQIKGRNVTIRDATDEICVLHMFGPKSGDCLGAIEPRIDGLPFMRSIRLENFAGLKNISPVMVFRISFTGMMGYEFHFKSEDGPAIHAALMNHKSAEEHKLRLAGGAAVNSFRTEQGFKVRADLDYAHYTEASIDIFLSKKRDFLGKNPNAKPKRRFSIFQVETTPGWEWSIVGDLPILHKPTGDIIGYTTTSARGATTNKTVALGFVLDKAFERVEDSSAEFEIRAYGHTWPVSIFKNPPVTVDRAAWHKQAD